MKNKVRIGKIWFPVLTLGYGRRIGIWMQGCSHSCRGCISPELQLSEAGIDYSVDEVMALLGQCLESADGVTISGGEPFDQPEALEELVSRFLQFGQDDILVFTGYTREELQRKNIDCINRVLEEIAVLIDGPYLMNLNFGRGLKGSENQRIWVNRYNERYLNSEYCERKQQCVMIGQQLWMIGIPAR